MSYPVVNHRHFGFGFEHYIDSVNHKLVLVNKASHSPEGTLTTQVDSIYEYPTEQELADWLAQSKEKLPLELQLFLLAVNKAINKMRGT